MYLLSQLFKKSNDPNPHEYDLINTEPSVMPWVFNLGLFLLALFELGLLVLIWQLGTQKVYLILTVLLVGEIVFAFANVAQKTYISTYEPVYQVDGYARQTRIKHVSVLGNLESPIEALTVLGYFIYIMLFV